MSLMIILMKIISQTSVEQANSSIPASQQILEIHPKPNFPYVHSYTQFNIKLNFESIREVLAKMDGGNWSAGLDVQCQWTLDVAEWYNN